MPAPEISIIVPAFNEVQSVPRLHQAISHALEGVDYELIVVDDGSRDGTYDVLRGLQRDDKRLVIIRFRRNFGQTAAMDAGIKHARGRILVTMDADLQNDPADIPRLVAALGEQRVDAVSGWRYRRNDPIGKRIASKFANRVRRFITKERIHDSGCTLKAFRRECFDDLSLYGEMHRYIPAILAWRGFRVGELRVQHHQRKHGKTKYNAKRILRGFLDLLVIKFWMQYSTRPIHLFGGVGLLMAAFGCLLGAWLTLSKLLWHTSLSDRPLLLLAVLLVIVGVQFILFGLMADILVKTYYRGHQAYTVADVRRR